MYESKKYELAERTLYNKYKIEKLIFKGLHRHGDNYSNVFESLPRSIRSLYTHALQSYIWNLIVSRRIKEYGLKLVVNDLVGVRKSTTSNEVAQKQEEEIEEDLEALKEEVVDDDEEVETVLITQENINNFTIHDLVAPLYGPSTIIPPESILYSYIQDVLHSLELTDQDFVKNSKLYCFKGQFRKAIVKPAKADFKIISHMNPKD